MDFNRRTASIITRIINDAVRSSIAPGISVGIIVIDGY